MRTPTQLLASKELGVCFYDLGDVTVALVVQVKEPQ